MTKFESNKLPASSEKVTICRDDLARYVPAHGTFVPISGKRPIHKNWTTRNYSSAKVLARCLEQNANVGVRLPASVVVIDIDPRNGGDDGWDDLCMEYGLDDTAWPCVVTGSGGRHYYLTKPADVSVVDTLKDFPGVEFKSKGRQVVAAGSIHPDTGRHYRWAEDGPDPAVLPDVPDELLKAIKRPERPTLSASGGELDQEQVAAVLARMDATNYRDHDRWLRLMMSVHHASDGDARQEWIDWCISDTQYADQADAIGRRWDSLHTQRAEGTITIGTLRHFLAEEGALDALPPDQEAARDDFNDGFEDDSWMEGPADVEAEPMRFDMNRANEMIEYAERSMLDGGAPLYQMGGRIVHPVRMERAAKDEAGVRREAGALIIQEVRPSRLLLYMLKHARFYRVHKPPRGEPVTKKHPAPQKLADLAVARSDMWTYPRLTGVVETPTLREDGTLLSEPGYDSASGLLLDMGGVEFPDIPDAPTRAEALTALAMLKEPFSDFPFVQDGPKGTSASRSVALSMALTALVRRTLPSAPMHGVSAPTPGTGKTLAIQAAAMIAMGRQVTAMSQGASEEEDEKRLFSVFMQGDQVVLMDNVTRPIGGNALCTILTESTWQNRVLGESRNVSVPTNALLAATGNNLTFAGDMTRRALLCRMDAGLENPEGRTFDRDLRQWVPARRVVLVTAGLTILRAFVVAGRPGLDRLGPFGSFEQWSNLIRGALVWLGEADPCLTRQYIVNDDPVRGQLADFFRAAHEAMGSRRFTAGELMDAALEATNDLNEVISTAVQKANRLSVGHFLKANQNRIVGGLTLRAEYDKKSKGWQYLIATQR